MTANPAGAMQVEIDGVAASADQLRAAALGGFGHFTTMQIRGGRVRGFGRHLHRLDAANRELFGTAIDAAAVRDHIRHALGDDSCDATVRVSVLEADGSPLTMVTVRPPGGMPGAGAPWKLRAVPYQRSLAHIKRTGDFGQRYYQRLAHASGFDEALLTGPDAIISEGSITNIGFFDGAEVIWPAAPVLAGITMQLLEPALADRGLPSRRAHVRVPDLASFAAVFVTNARGIAPVAQVDDLRLTADASFMGRLTDAYESAGWDSI
jgi:branched-subunit amino acid aminotransferase/4-amino-4-deoxychorismate lyase